MSTVSVEHPTLQEGEFVLAQPGEPIVNNIPEDSAKRVEIRWF